MSVMGRGTVQEVRNGSRGPPGVPGLVWGPSDPGVWDAWGCPSEYPRRVGRSSVRSGTGRVTLPVWVGRSSRRSGTGWLVLPEVQDGS